MISIIKPLVWLELIMICSIDLFGDTKLSKAFTQEAGWSTKLVPIKSAFKF